MEVVVRLARFIGCTKGVALCFVLASNYVMLYVCPTLVCGTPTRAPLFNSSLRCGAKLQQSRDK